MNPSKFYLLFLSNQIVAPFSGIALLTDSANEIMINNSGELPPGSQLIITNVDATTGIKHIKDPLYVEKRVSLGDKSVCHIKST